MLYIHNYDGAVMPVVSQPLPLIDEIASEEANSTTSSQILLSRGVARSDARPVVSTKVHPKVSTSLVYESGSMHAMSLSQAAYSSASDDDSVRGLQGKVEPPSH